MDILKEANQTEVSVERSMFLNDDEIKEMTSIAKYSIANFKAAKNCTEFDENLVKNELFFTCYGYLGLEVFNGLKYKFGYFSVVVGDSSKHAAWFIDAKKLLELRFGRLFFTIYRLNNN